MWTMIICLNWPAELSAQKCVFTFFFECNKERKTEQAKNDEPSKSEWRHHHRADESYISEPHSSRFTVSFSFSCSFSFFFPLSNFNLPTHSQPISALFFFFFVCLPNCLCESRCSVFGPRKEWNSEQQQRQQKKCYNMKNQKRSERQSQTTRASIETDEYHNTSASSGRTFFSLCRTFMQQRRRLSTF